MDYFQEELPPPEGIASVDTFESGFSIETIDSGSLESYDKSNPLKVISEIPTEYAVQRERAVPDDDETYDDHDEILEYHYPMIEEADDSSLAARDSLALEPSIRYSESNDSYQKGWRRRSLWLLICVLTLAIIVILAIAIPRSLQQKDDRDAFADELGQQSQNISPAPSAAPSMQPTVQARHSLAFKTLEPKVEEPDLLLDPATPQGMAFQSVLSEDLTDPFRIVQRYALLVLYYSTGGANWGVNLQWEQLMEDECDWYGINGCRAQSGKRAVSVLELASNNLDGILPHEICMLERLENIVLSNNFLKGALPACLTSLEKLKEIDIYGNEFSGPLPVGLLAMKALTRLDFSNNQLSGSLDVLFIDDESNGFPTFQTLRALRLDNNAFTGQPPSHLVIMLTLEILTLHENQLTGTLDFFCSDSINAPTMFSADCNVVQCSCCTECH